MIKIVYPVIETPSESYKKIPGALFKESSVVAWCYVARDAYQLANGLSSQWNATEFYVGNPVEIEVPDGH